MSERRIANDLYDLTETLVKAGHETTGGLLGGEYGYGAFFENEVFMMHPYCWCDGADCPWCRGCECVLRDKGDGYDWDERYEVVEECSVCKDDPPREPNFRHKPSGARVSWYKYIGRGMEVDLNGADWRQILRECEQSIGGAA